MTEKVPETGLVITEDMITNAYRVFLEEVNPPYSADIRSFTAADVKAGKLREADDECERLNRDIIRRVIEAALLSQPDYHRNQ